MSGRVSLIGAGPGNPELLTLLAQRRLAEADVIVYDRLVNPALLAPYAAEKIDVGKLPHHHKVSQYQINDMLVELAQSGKRVARLKAGDPYVFGRGGEEGQYLKQHHVAFEVVPGLTSAIAGLAAAGIPITHRDYASSFHVITGHRKAEGKELDWANIAHQEGTLVFLMGMEQLATIADQLVTNGMPATTPVAVIQWATHWKQRSVSADLATIVDVVAAAKIGAPALIVVGGVVKLMPELQPQLALQGLHLLIPFKAESKLFAALQDEGASVNYFDRRKKQPRAVALPDMTAGGTLVITDFAAFHYFQQQLLTLGVDGRSLNHWQLVAMNRVVATRLQETGLLADALYDEQQLDLTQPVVYLGEQAALAQLNGPATAQYLATYESIAVPQSVDLADFHAVVFPSSASVNDLYAGCDAAQRAQLQTMTCFAMGQTVADECQKLGLHAIVAAPSYDDVIQAVKKEFSTDESNRVTGR
ncbi:uroporphyrinogen-III C-methyltransferase [Secundilactobacillus muriivasis]